MYRIGIEGGLGAMGPLAARTRPWVIGTSRRLRKFRRLYGPGSFLGYEGRGPSWPGYQVRVVRGSRS